MLLCEHYLGGAVVIQEGTSNILDISAFIGTGAALMSTIPEDIAEFVTKKGTQLFDSKFVANMWSAKNKVKG